MALPTPERAEPDTDDLLRSMGFDLRSVTWGYQELFRDAICELHRSGLIRSSEDPVTRVLFEVLQRGDKSTFDSVLKAFLGAANGQHRWVLRLPRLFERWCTVGLELAKRRHFLAMRFFDLAGTGALGTTPAEVEFILDMVSLLGERQPDLVSSLMEGYHVASERLDSAALRGFIFEAIRLYQRNPETGKKFLSCELASSREALDRMSRQASLPALRPALERLARGLTGVDVPVAGLELLDSDDLVERGASFIVCPTGMYVPSAIEQFAEREANSSLYRTLVCVGSACLLARGFAVVHGSPGLQNCTFLFEQAKPDSYSRSVLFCIAETTRILHYCNHRFPGIRSRLRALVEEYAEGRLHWSPSDRLLARALGLEIRLYPGHLRQLGACVDDIAQRSSSFSMTAGLLRELPSPLPRLTTPRPVFFLPDPFFKMEIACAGLDTLRIDLRDLRTTAPDEASPGVEPETDPASDTESESSHPAAAGAAEQVGREQGACGGVALGFYYHEWNIHCADYFRDWCCVREQRPRGHGIGAAVSPHLADYASEVRRIFERLRPDEMRELTRLPEGDTIHLDHFVEYISQRETVHDTEMRFYTKAFTVQRSIATALLLDLSGSTAEDCPAASMSGGDRRILGVPELQDDRPKTVLQTEKEAAFVLSTGLASLGDTCGVFGFTGNGRENCRFEVFKEFSESWDSTCASSLFAAKAGSSTRIGPALRHAGWKLGGTSEKTKLLLLITDGKPCDQGYDPDTKYAQHDVRRACQENRQNGIHTFCISTNENTSADMELMFPSERYLILDNIARLPAILSRLYLRLTH